jgi:hypothetical protein
MNLLITAQVVIREKLTRYDVADCMKDGLDSCGRCGKYPCDKIQTAFERTKSFEATIREACSEAEYRQLKKAFYEKKENLDRMHRQFV